MNEIIVRCPHCFKDSYAQPNGQVVNCGHCGGPFVPAATTAIPVTPSTRRERRRKSANSVWGLFAAMVCAMLLIIAIIPIFARGNRHQQTPAEAARKKEASDRELKIYELNRTAQKVVQASLKAPKTAEFDVLAPQVDWPFNVTIRGKVSSQNSFGAFLTNDFEVAFYRDSSAKDFEIVEITVGDQTAKFAYRD